MTERAGLGRLGGWGHLHNLPIDATVTAIGWNLRTGELAREIGTATLTIRGDGGQEQTATAKFVVVWKRQGGEWRWHTDIWNTDA